MTARRDLPDILTPRELGDYLRVSEATIRNMAAAGDIPDAFRVGKQWRFHSTVIDTLMASGAASEEPKAAPSMTRIAPPRSRRRRTEPGSSFAERFPHVARKRG